MSLNSLKAEIARKKGLLKDPTKLNEDKSPSQNCDSSKKWRRKADIEREREQEYLENQRKLEEERQARKRMKLASEADKSHSVQNVKSEAPNDRTEEKNKEDKQAEKRDSVANANSTPIIPKAEVIRRLRLFGHPATLFGETDWDRFLRLRNFEVSLADKDDGGSEYLQTGKRPTGQKNVFQAKLRAREAKEFEQDSEQLYWDNAASKSKQKAQKDNFVNADDQEENLDNFDDLESLSGILKRLKSSALKIKPVGSNDSVENFISSRIVKFMIMWERDLNNRPEKEKRTAQGRSAHARWEQNEEYLKPVLDKLAHKSLDPGILKALKTIFSFIDEREYVKANDEYLRLAIGNAPWPVGATMVGIHARSAREKIGEGKIAHVMNDEQTRKYIQAIKRLITIAQKWFPTVPSKMITS